jgi:hypothetical protein
VTLASASHLDAGTRQCVGNVLATIDSVVPLVEAYLLGPAAAAIAWPERQPGGEFARLHATRARHYLDHGSWISKEEAR